MTDTGAPIRILLLEDSAIDAELAIAQLAGQHHHEVEWISNRAAFEAALARRQFDIIVADYSLPDFDGLTALSMTLRQAPGMPFIFVSGVVGEEFATSAITQGATDYIVKRNLPRLPAAIDRAIAEANERRERQRAEEALHKLNAVLAQEIETRTRERDRIWRLSRDLFAACDMQGVLLSVNPAWWRSLGYEESRLRATSFGALFHSEDVPHFTALLARLNDGQPVENFECRMRARDGAYRWIAWTAVPEGSEFYAVGRDVSDAKQSAADLARVNDELRAEMQERERVESTLSQLQRLDAVGQVTAGVAHDFNNLLSVVIGNIGFLERMGSSRADAKEQRHLSHIRQAAERGARLTTQLLAFSRRQRLAPKTVDLNDTVSGMRELLQSSLGGSVALQTHLNAKLWPAMVDSTQIEMMILNLAINARDAMPEGGELSISTDNVAIAAATTADLPAPPGEYVQLAVTDNGTGMLPEVVAKAFEPFFTTKGPGRGSGLGLAQVYGFAKQSGGGVRIRTEIGAGTTVFVYLPRARTPPRVATPAVARSEPSTRCARILLVDDDASVRAVTATILAEAGHAVIEASAGRAALDLLSREPVDLLLVDYAMPGMNGAETVAEAQRLRPGLPAVFVTGFADLPALRELGDDYILQKPYRDEDLRRKVNAALVRAADNEKAATL